MSTLGEAFVIIKADQSQLRPGLSKARQTVEHETDRMGKATEAMGHRMKHIFMGLAAVGGISFGFEKFIEAAVAQERSMTKLRSTLSATGESVKENYTRLNEFSDALARASNLSPVLIRDVMSLGLNMGIGANQIEDFTKIAVGLAEAMGTDVPTAMEALYKAEQGSFLALERKLPILKQATTAEQKFAMIQRLAAQGMAERIAQTDTLGGRIEKLKNSVEELSASSGGLIAGPLGWMFDRIAESMRQMTANTEESTQTMLTFAKAWEYLTTQIVVGDPKVEAAGKARIEEIEAEIQASMNRQVNASGRATEMKIKHLNLLRGATAQTVNSLNDIWKNANKAFAAGDASIVRATGKAAQARPVPTAAAPAAAAKPLPVPRPAPPAAPTPPPAGAKPVPAPPVAQHPALVTPHPATPQGAAKKPPVVKFKPDENDDKPANKPLIRNRAYYRDQAQLHQDMARQLEHYNNRTTFPDDTGGKNEKKIQELRDRSKRESDIAEFGGPTEAARQREDLRRRQADQKKVDQYRADNKAKFDKMETDAKDQLKDAPQLMQDRLDQIAKQRDEANKIDATRAKSYRSYEKGDEANRREKLKPQISKELNQYTNPSPADVAAEQLTLQRYVRIG